MYKHIFKKANLILLSLLLGVVTLSGCKNANIVLTTEFEEGEIMRINTLSCYEPEMMLYLTNTQNEYENVYGSEIWTKTLDGVELSKSIKDKVLARVAEIKVMVLMAENYEITLTDEDKERVSEASKLYFDSLNSTEIELTGATLETVEGIYTDYALANKVYDYIIRDINPEISDDEARTITVQQILIRTYALDGEGNKVEYTDRAKAEAKKLAEDILAMAVNEEDPADFELLAAEYNEGDAITYSFGRGEMAQAFEDAAFMLDNDEISDVVETEYGYHIIKCISTFDIDQTQDNKVEILQERKDKAFEETYNEFILGLKKNLNEEFFDSIELISDERVTTSDMFSDKYLSGL